MQYNVTLAVNGSDLTGELKNENLPKMALNSFDLNLCSRCYCFGHEMKGVAVKWVRRESRFGLVVLYQQVQLRTSSAEQAAEQALGILRPRLDRCVPLPRGC